MNFYFFIGDYEQTHTAFSTNWYLMRWENDAESLTLFYNLLHVWVY